MKLVKTIGRYIIVGSISMIVAGCGTGSGSHKNKNEETTTTPQTTPLAEHDETHQGENKEDNSSHVHMPKPTQNITACSMDKAIDTYTPLKSGDRIHKEQSNTIIILYHYQDERKFVCTQKGNAVIIRE